MMDWFSNWFSELFFVITKVVFTLLYYLQDSFMILAGAKRIQDVIDGVAGGFEDATDKGNTGNILEDLLFGYWDKESGSNNEMVGNIFLVFFWSAICFFVVAMVFAVIKSMLSTDRQGSMKKTIIASLKTIVYFFGVPVLFYFCINQGTKLIQAIIKAVDGTVGSGGSMAETFFRACYSGSLPENLSIVNDSYSTFNEFTKGGFDFFDGNFQYIIALVAGCVMLYSMFIATFGLAERLINIALLYVISPIVIATMSLDDGERLKTWKDLVLAKFLGAMGNILSMYLFMVLISYWGTVNETLKNHISMNMNSSAFWITMLLYLIIGCGGAFVCAKGSNLIANIISQRAGEQDGLGTMTTSNLASKGFGLAKSLGLGAVGAVLGNKNARNALSSMATGNSVGGNTGSSAGEGTNVQTASMNNAQGGFNANSISQTQNSLATNGGSSGLMSKLKSAGSKAVNSPVGSMVGKMGAIGATGLAMAGGLVAPLALAVGFGLKPALKAGKGLVSGIKNKFFTDKSGLKMSKKEAKDAGFTKGERKEFNENAKALAKEAKQLDKAYKKEDKLERKANSQTEKMLKLQEKGKTPNDKILNKANKANDALTKQKDTVSNKKNSYDEANKQFNSSQNLLENRKRNLANRRREDMDETRNRRSKAKASSPKDIIREDKEAQAKKASKEGGNK